MLRVLLYISVERNPELFAVTFKTMKTVVPKLPYKKFIYFTIYILEKKKIELLFLRRLW